MSEHPNDLLGLYSLEALDVDEQHQVSEHLANCPGCRAELDELESLRARLEQVPAEAFLDGPPDGGDSSWPAPSARPAPNAAGHRFGPSPPPYCSSWSRWLAGC